MVVCRAYITKWPFGRNGAILPFVWWTRAFWKESLFYLRRGRTAVAVPPWASAFLSGSRFLAVHGVEVKREFSPVSIAIVFPRPVPLPIHSTIYYELCDKYSSCFGIPYRESGACDTCIVKREVPRIEGFTGARVQKTSRHYRTVPRGHWCVGVVWYQKETQSNLSLIENQPLFFTSHKMNTCRRAVSRSKALYINLVDHPSHILSKLSK